VLGRAWEIGNIGSTRALRFSTVAIATCIKIERRVQSEFEVTVTEIENIDQLRKYRKDLITC
jgi:hypothetical protein